MSRAILVGLGPRSYQVRVGEGLIDAAGEAMAPLVRRRRTAIVSDETVWGLHGARLAGALSRAGIAATPIVMPPGEQTKSFDGLAQVTDRLLALELDRGDVIT